MLLLWSTRNLWILGTPFPLKMGCYNDEAEISSSHWQFLETRGPLPLTFQEKIGKKILTGKKWSWKSESLKRKMEESYCWIDLNLEYWVRKVKKKKNTSGIDCRQLSQKMLMLESIYLIFNWLLRICGVRWVSSSWKDLKCKYYLELIVVIWYLSLQRS